MKRSSKTPNYNDLAAVEARQLFKELLGADMTKMKLFETKESERYTEAVAKIDQLITELHKVEDAFLAAREYICSGIEDPDTTPARLVVYNKYMATSPHDLAGQIHTRRTLTARAKFPYTYRG